MGYARQSAFIESLSFKRAMLASVPASHEADMFLFIKLSKNLKKQRMAKLDHLARNVNPHLFLKHVISS